MTALNQAYASNDQTPLITLEFLHSALSGGALRLVQGYYDIQATLEDSTTVTFSASGIGVTLPEKSTDGRQDLDIQLDNVSNLVWQEISGVVTASRASSEVVICKYRPFLESDLSAPAGAAYVLAVTQSSINRVTASLTASFAQIPDMAYPKGRYYPTVYPGLRYV
jgi:hypothetical protein